MFTVHFSTDNAAFAFDDEAGPDRQSAGLEAARILRGIADALELDTFGTAAEHRIPVIDANGNTVGGWSIGAVGSSIILNDAWRLTGEVAR